MAHALGQRPGQMLRSVKSDPAALAAIAEGLREQKHVHVEIEYAKKDGTPFWAEVEINPQRDDAGAFVGFVGILKDITERREQEARVRGALAAASESLALLHSVTAEAPAVLFQFLSCPSQPAQWICVSPESEGVFGREPRTLSERPSLFWQMIQPQDLTALQEGFLAAESLQSPIERELCLRPPNGNCQWFTLRAQPRLLATGETQWTGSMVDSTKEHAQRADLKRLLELNTSVLDASPFSIMFRCCPQS